MNQNLFSYGTLQDTAVQQELFNRNLGGHRDSIVGYRLSSIEIKDEEVIKISGLTHHLMLIPGDSQDLVDGMVFEITDEELGRADEYEAEDYKRVLVSTVNGDKAWVYIQSERITT